MSREIEVNAIREADLKRLLRDSELYTGIEAGTAHCVVCGNTVRWDDIGAVRIENGNPVVVCSAGDCLMVAGAAHVDG